VAWRCASSKYAGTVTTARVTGSPSASSATARTRRRICAATSCGEIGWPWMRIHASPFGAATMRNGARRANHETSSALTLRPINRFTPNTVADAFVTACRFARVPTVACPLVFQLTHDGMVRSLSRPTRIVGWPFASSTATHEFVVPKSMPMIFDVVIGSPHRHSAVLRARRSSVLSFRRPSFP
jgi:hypothetical protein